ncbi:MAG: hypothetical protein E3J72_19650 [Planctomycetota bacterium]|nr:MAG: hypothetical protein E3J72_19650 [Planctomycetota bacterium]
MNCRKAQKVLTDAIGKGATLDPKVEEHLEDCPYCRLEKARLEEMWGLLDSYNTPKASAGFTSSLMAGIRSEQPAPEPIHTGSGLKRWRMVSALAASLVIAVILCVLWVKPLFKQDVVRVEPQDAGQTAQAISDEDIIKDLEVFENIDMLQNMALLSEYDVIENLGDTLDEENR